MEEPNAESEDKSRILFDKFLATCRNGQKKSPEMEEIIRKTSGFYKKTKPEYLQSQEFQSLLTLKIEEITNNPRRVYVYVKDVVDEIRSRKQKPTKSSEPPTKKLKLSENTNGDIGEGTSTSTKEENKEEVEKIDIEAIANQAETRYKDRKVRKLSRALKRINVVIKKLEEKEVDFDEENDSTYIKLERYKDRFCKIHSKLCELTGDTTVNRLSRRIEFSGTDSPEVNRCIEKFVNKTGQFPDFHDILKLVKTIESTQKMKPEAVRRIAQNAFLCIGRQLQLKRQYESWDSLSDFLKNQADPAEENSELNTVLEKNLEDHAKRIQEVIDSFAEQQNKDNLEAEEVPDDVASKSEESEEGEEAEEDELEEEKDFVDKVLDEEDGAYLGEDAEMAPEEEDSASDEEDGTKDGESNSEKKETSSEHSRPVSHSVKNSSSSHDTADSPYLADENSEQDTLSLEVYNLTPTKRNMGPVSPPILGEVLSDLDFASTETAQKVSSPPASPQLQSKDEDESHFEEKHKPGEVLDEESTESESLLEGPAMSSVDKSGNLENEPEDLVNAGEQKEPEVAENSDVLIDGEQKEHEVAEISVVLNAGEQKEPEVAENSGLLNASKHVNSDPSEQKKPEVPENPEDPLNANENMEVLSDFKDSKIKPFDDEDSRTSGKEISAIESENSSEDELTESGCQSNNKILASNLESVIQFTKSVTSVENWDSPPNSSLEPIIKLEEEEEEESGLSSNISDKKFVVTKMEMGFPRKGNQNPSIRKRVIGHRLRQNPHIIKKVPPECVDVITLE